MGETFLKIDVIINNCIPHESFFHLNSIKLSALK